MHIYVLHSIRTKPQNLNTLISFTIIITANAKRDRMKQNTTRRGNDDLHTVDILPFEFE